MIKVNTFKYKAITKLHRIFIINNKNKNFYYCLYKSYWNYLLNKNSDNSNIKQYISARPNPGAGIGHQLANWFAGNKIARYYGLEYCVYPFSDLNNPLKPNKWNDFLGLNEGLTYTEDLQRSGYRLLLLPLINWDLLEERTILKNIIDSYSGEKVIFLLEMDQHAGDELEDVEMYRNKFFSSPKNCVNYCYNREHFNVAIHIRRGDIVQTGKKKDKNLTIRWLDISYYKKILEKYLKLYSGDKFVDIYLFSQADSDELKGFEEYGNVIYCNKMSAIQSF